MHTILRAKERNYDSSRSCPLNKTDEAMIKPPDSPKHSQRKQNTRLKSSNHLGVSADGEKKHSHAYRQIKDLIINGTFDSMQALREVELSQMLNVSRTPIREALRQLASENFVKYVANKGVVVSDIGLAEVEDMMEARLTVEVATVRMCIQRMDGTILIELRDCLTQQEEALDRGDSAEFASHDRQFHRIIVAAARNARLEGFWESLIDHTQLIMNKVFTSVTDILSVSYAKHQDIFEAITTRNADAAARLTEEHVNDLRGDIVGIILDNQKNRK